MITEITEVAMIDVEVEIKAIIIVVVAMQVEAIISTIMTGFAFYIFKFYEIEMLTNF